MKKTIEIEISEFQCDILATLESDSTYCKGYSELDYNLSLFELKKGEFIEEIHNDYSVRFCRITPKDGENSIKVKGAFCFKKEDEAMEFLKTKNKINTQNIMELLGECLSKIKNIEGKLDKLRNL